jgi:hypothetical protein
VAVNRAGERLAARIVRGNGDYRMTAASTVVFGEAMTGLRTGRSGVYAPEQLFTLEQLKPNFERRGFEFVEP